MREDDGIDDGSAPRTIEGEHGFAFSESRGVAVGPVVPRRHRARGGRTHAGQQSLRCLRIGGDDDGIGVECGAVIEHDATRGDGSDRCVETHIEGCGELLGDALHAERRDGGSALDEGPQHEVEESP